jgi:hypothetical protein
MHLAAHRWHNFVIAVFMTDIGFDFQRMLPPMFEQNHLATSAFLLKQLCYTWEKWCRARAEHFFVWVWGEVGLLL